MSDLELLELAAKAAEYEVIFDSWGNWIKEGSKTRYWNPATDDGDALRLAVKLRLGVEWIDSDTVFCGSPVHVFNGDPYAATRLAIVRAAAAIGKEMK